MAKETPKDPDEPIEPVQRRPTDVLWFAVLFVSIATGIGMTIFAPVGDEPPAAASITPPLPATTFTTQPSTSPSTARTP